MQVSMFSYEVGKYNPGLLPKRDVRGTANHATTRGEGVRFSECRMWVPDVGAYPLFGARHHQQQRCRLRQPWISPNCVQFMLVPTCIRFLLNSHRFPLISTDSHHQQQRCRPSQPASDLPKVGTYVGSRKNTL